MTTPTPILTLAELDEIESSFRIARNYEDDSYHWADSHALGLIMSHRALLQRREAAGVKDTSLNAEEQALDDALARLLKPWPADIINDENIGPITMRQAVLIRRSIRNAAKQRFWNEFYIKEVLSQRQEAGDNPLSEMEMNYEGALSDCQAAVTVLIRRINGEADLASAAEWIRLNYPKRAAELAQPLSPIPPSRDEIAKEIASFACRRHLINSNAYEALADRIFALINGASNAG